MEGFWAKKYVMSESRKLREASSVWGQEIQHGCVSSMMAGTQQALRVFK